MLRSNRQSKILDIINSHEIETQEELVLELCKGGYDITQATISRDIKELGLIKTQSQSGKYKYSTVKSVDLKISNKLINVFREAVISIIVANNLLVIKTLTGSANAVAMVIDQLNLKEMVGSIAGDDTLLIITINENDAQTLKKRLENIIE